MQAAIDQMHLPPSPYRPVMLPLQDGSQFGIRIDGPAGAAFSLHPERGHLTLEDASRHPVTNDGRLVFDSCIPFPESYGGATGDDRPNYWIGFRLNWTGLASGMYRILASFEPTFATFPDGKSIPFDKRFGPASTTVYVPPSPVRQPSLEAGQRFIAVTGSAGAWTMPRFSDSNGNAIPLDVGGRVFTLVSVSDTALQFKSDGIEGTLALSRTPGATSIPNLYPLVDDGTVLRLRAAYQGRPVWGYGGAEVWEGAGSRDSTRDPLTITGIYRICGFSTTMAIGSPQFWGVDLGSDFDALNPLVVIFQTPPSLRQTPSWMSRNLSPDTTVYSLVSDAWDFERSYSLASMVSEHPSWPQATIEDIDQGFVKIGMSKSMIAWMFGYPNAYGTAAQVSKLDTWNYDAPTPGQFAVHFKHGVVVKFDPPGQLP